MSQEFAAPVYFAARDIAGKRFRLKRGDQFPASFDKQTIRWLAPSLGVTEATAFCDLPYVKTLNAGTHEMAQVIRDKGLGYEGAKRLLEGSAADA